MLIIQSGHGGKEKNPIISTSRNWTLVPPNL